jgi:hypothetical protein
VHQRDLRRRVAIKIRRDLDRFRFFAAEGGDELRFPRLVGSRDENAFLFGCPAGDRIAQFLPV